jgi:hypothetical protein
VVLKSKHKGVRGKLNSRWNSLLLPLTHRKLLSKAIPLENDLHGTLRNFGLKVGIAGSMKGRGTEQGLVENLSDLAVLIFPCPTFPNLLHCMSPLLALSCRADQRLSRQLSGAKRTRRLERVAAANDPYRPFALRHRCDAAWAACSYPDHLLNHLVGTRPHPHPPPSRCAISTMVLR